MITTDEEEANVAMTTTPSLPKAPEVVSKSPEVAPSTSPSNNGNDRITSLMTSSPRNVGTEVVKKRKFTAVTSSGESASIDEIRQKQAERRQRALLFIEAKRLEKVSASGFRFSILTSRFRNNNKLILKIRVKISLIYRKKSPKLKGR